MSVNDLSQFEFLQGLFALIFVIISLVVGIRILMRYFTVKHKEYLTVGLAWILLTSGWWGAAVNFPLIVFYGSEAALPPIFDLTIDSIFIPIALVCWIYSFCKLTIPQSNPKLSKRIIWVYVIICSIYEVFLIIFLITDPSIIGKMTSIFSVTFNLYVVVFVIFASFTLMISGIFFARKSLKSEDKKIRWKGRFLFIAFVTFTACGILDASIDMTPVILILVRVFLISCAIEYYLGFLLPEKIANLLIKDRNR